MCGIAGYNASRKWMEEYIETPDIQHQILQEAWLHNLHRGSDAAGYFALRNDNNIKVYKHGSSAYKLLTENLKKSVIDPTPVFGAHTRARTKGDQKINSNNHPVNFNGVWVTHNGMIRNDEEIKKTASSGHQIAEVDSVAIPIVLREVKNPRSIVDVRSALARLDGSYAIHAVWRNHPNVSLFARGSNSPMLLAVHEDGCVMYASVVEALWSMINAMGMDPNSSAWSYHTLAEYSAFIVEDGIPITFTNLIKPAWGNVGGRNKVGYTVERVLPIEGRPVVYATDLNNDFAVKNQAFGRDLEVVDTEKIEEVYSRSNGFSDPKEKFPRQSDWNIFSLVSEADIVYKNKISGNHHVFFGDIEIILDGRSVCDIYNHALFKTEDRWNIIKKEDVVDVPLAYTDFADFIKRQGNEIKQTPNAAAPYAYARNNQNNGFNGQYDRSPGEQLALPRSQQRTKHLEYMRPFASLSWTNVWDLVSDHDTPRFSKRGFVFENGTRTCHVHNNQTLVKHTRPDKCDICKGAAIFTLSSAPTLDLVNLLVPDAAIMRVDNVENVCAPGTEHEFYASQVAEFHLGQTYYVDLVTAEECLNCGATQKLINMPEWLVKCVARRKPCYAGYVGA